MILGTPPVRWGWLRGPPPPFPPPPNPATGPVRRSPPSDSAPSTRIRFPGEFASRSGHGGWEGHAHAFLDAEDAASRLRPGDGRLADSGRPRGGRRPGRRDRLARDRPRSRPARGRRDGRAAAAGRHWRRDPRRPGADRGERDRACPLRRRAADLDRDDRRPARGPRRLAGGGDDADDRARRPRRLRPRRPHRLRRGRAGGRGESGRRRRRRTAGDPRDQRRHLRLRRGAAGRRARRHLQRQRPRRVLPARRLPGAAGGRPHASPPTSPTTWR